MRKNLSEHKYILFLVCIPLVLVACESEVGENGGSVSSEYTLEFDRETFERERQLWLEQDFQNYSFKQRYAWAMGWWIDDPTVYVQNGFAIFSSGKILGHNDLIHYPGIDSNAFFASQTLLILSISDIYAEIEKWANEDDTHRIDVAYHSTLHYPTEVYVGLRVGCPPRTNVLGGLELSGATVRICNFVLDPEIPETPIPE